jgi:hypothetical protein
VDHPRGDQAGFLIALCASRGVLLLFDPTPRGVIQGDSPPRRRPTRAAGA